MTDPSILRRAEQLGHTSRRSGCLRDSNAYVKHRWATGPERCVMTLPPAGGADGIKPTWRLRRSPK